ncbi:ACT domain-containing protein [Thalassotalea mangrovi]|uniref:ACT domain-containing protein n=1 Tax=Thalassotalea mangrovi TaxID=2572245 RepID=A0A4U1B370_9GAMM|nr:ACT domain-containing protein [Thalassotalea mangrovi]TKB44354.1 ACT domain-containing protein [Thalassotalea mangrovi]
MTKQTLQLLDELFNIHSFEQDSPIPAEVFSASVFFIAKTYEELSVVVPNTVALTSQEVESDWRALEVLGPLGFSLTGIMSQISGVLAAQQISIFAISTFDTDYILIKQDKVQLAINALRTDGYMVIQP